MENNEPMRDVQDTLRLSGGDFVKWVRITVCLNHRRRWCLIWIITRLLFIIAMDRL